MLYNKGCSTPSITDDSTCVQDRDTPEAIHIVNNTIDILNVCEKTISILSNRLEPILKLVDNTPELNVQVKCVTIDKPILAQTQVGVRLVVLHDMTCAIIYTIDRLLNSLGVWEIAIGEYDSNAAVDDDSCALENVISFGGEIGVILSDIFKALYRLLAITRVLDNHLNMFTINSTACLSKQSSCVEDNQVVGCDFLSTLNQMKYNTTDILNKLESISMNVVL